MLRNKFLALSVLIFSSSTFAAYSSDQTPQVYPSNNGYQSSHSGYSSSGSSVTTSTTTTQTPGYASGSYSTDRNGGFTWHHRYRSGNGGITITVNRPSTAPSYAPQNPGYSYHDYNEQIPGLRWITLSAGERIPPFTVIGGGQPEYTLFVCRAPYRGGVHPGKLIAGNCNIGWGGREVVLRNYDVLVANRELGWVSASNGEVPANAIPGGYDQSGTLYICQADYRGGRHPGKLIGNACNIGYGRREVRIPYYYVLVG